MMLYESVVPGTAVSPVTGCHIFYVIFVYSVDRITKKTIIRNIFWKDRHIVYDAVSDEKI